MDTRMPVAGNMNLLDIGELCTYHNFTKHYDRTIAKVPGMTWQPGSD